MYRHGATPYGDEGYQQVLQRHRDHNHGLLQGLEGAPAGVQRCVVAAAVVCLSVADEDGQVACAMLGLHHHSPSKRSQCCTAA
jgi:hypothetical protein